MCKLRRNNAKLIRSCVVHSRSAFYLARTSAMLMSCCLSDRIGFNRIHSDQIEFVPIARVGVLSLACVCSLS